MGEHNTEGRPKRRMVLNAFEMFSPSHLSFGQWARDDDQSADKTDLEYWTNLAQILERGGIHSLVIADTYGQHDVYEGSAKPTIERSCQFPMGDPTAPVTAMAAVTKDLGFVVTTSTSYESPFVVAKRFSTLDHLTKGRFGWNIVTSFKESAAKAVGLPYVAHDERYKIADEYVEILYRLWEGSWADDALKKSVETGVFTDPDRIRWIQHESENFSLDAPHILNPSPQRTPFLMQAGTSPAGIDFAAKHAEAVMVVAPSPHILAPRVAPIRKRASELGRNPYHVKVFAVVTPIIGKTSEEAQVKYQRALEYANAEAGLAFYSGNSGIDLSKYDLDTEITADDANIDGRVHSLAEALKYRGNDVGPRTPRNLGKEVAIGGNGPVPVGSAAEVADFLEEWARIADLDGFNIGYVVSPGSFEDLVDLLVPELQRRSLYSSGGDRGTLRERVFGSGHSKLYEDHPGSKFAFDRVEQKP